MERYGLANVLIFLGACVDSTRWAAKYGTDWERALKECRSSNYVLWLASTLAAKGFIARHILIKSFAEHAHSEAVRRGYADSALARDYVDWCDREGTPEQELLLAARAAHSIMYELRDIAETRSAGMFGTYTRLTLLRIPVDVLRQALGPHLISGLRAYAESLKDQP